MYFSIYNDNKFNTDKLFLKNLINSYHFSTTVRTPPNNYHNNFIGELKVRKKPKFDILFTNSLKKSQSSLIKNKNDFSKNKKIKRKTSDLPKLLTNNNIIKNYKSSKKDKCLLTNEILTNGIDMGIINLHFPYCKPKLKNSNSNIFINNKYKGKCLSTNNTKKRNFKRHRLFLKSLSNFHQIINKSNINKKKGKNNSSFIM